MRYEKTLAITNRLKSLLVLIRRGTYACRTLAERLGVSEQTVYRDIVFLRKQGHSIHSVRLSNRWAYRLNRSNGQGRRGDRRP
ncbi:MAG: sugar metabolism transcriptional regulator [Planctomycetota bacterium]|nr:MAG: sugar metabolism transcriptional regulator [Planctomycetota bacterium]